MKKVLVNVIHFPLRVYVLVLLGLLLLILAFINFLGATFSKLFDLIYLVVEFIGYLLLFPGNVDYGKWKWGTMSWHGFDWSMCDIQFGDMISWYKSWVPKKGKRQKERIEL